MYIERSIEDKIRILKEYWREGNLSEVARRNKVNRMSIYKWEKVAEEGMRKELSKLKPGKRDISIEQQNKKLKEQIKRLINFIHKEKKDIFDEITFCPKCKSDRVRKNGKVITRAKGIQQRYICLKCNLSIYVSLKKNL